MNGEQMRWISGVPLDDRKVHVDEREGRETTEKEGKG